MSEPVHISEPLFAVMKEIKEPMDNANEKHMVVYCDGAAEPTNPGPMGAGYVLQDADGKQIEARGYYLGHGSNNVAEYMGVIRAVEAAIRLGATRLDVRCDSQLIVKQVLGLWVINAPHLQPLRDKAVGLLNQIDRWDLEWIPRERNSRADVCANNAALFRRDVDYTGREILNTRDDSRAERVRAATGDYFKQHRGDWTPHHRKPQFRKKGQ